MVDRWKPHAGYHASTRENAQDEESKRFYHSGAWRRVRERALQRDHYICQLRLSPDCTTVATEVHHIKPRKKYPELALDLSNLTSCCWWCHELTKPRGKRSTQPRRSVRVIVMSGSADSDKKTMYGGAGRDKE